MPDSTGERPTGDQQEEPSPLPVFRLYVWLEDTVIGNPEIDELKKQLAERGMH